MTDDTALPLPARRIPVPQSVGPKAQAVLAAAAGNAVQWADYPALADVEGWREYGRIADENMLAMLSAAAMPMPSHDVSLLEIGEVRTFRVAPSMRAQQRGKIFLTIHGGALIAGGGRVCELSAAIQAAAMESLVYAPDYRMPPDHPFPTPLAAVWRHHPFPAHTADRRYARHVSVQCGAYAASSARR